MRKIMSIAFLSLLLCFTVISGAFAASLDDQREVPMVTKQGEKESRIPSALIQEKVQRDGGKLIITDKNQLRKIAVDEGLNKVPVKIEYEYVPLKTNSSNDIQRVSPMVDSTIWVDPNERGSGWYKPISDLYKEFYVDGPDTFEIEESTKESASFGGSFGASVSVIEAAINFSLDHEFTAVWKSTTPITANESIHFQLYTTHHRVDYQVYEGPEGDKYHSRCRGGGEAYDPNGVLIKKTFY